MHVAFTTEYDESGYMGIPHTRPFVKIRLVFLRKVILTFKSPKTPLQQFICVVSNGIPILKAVLLSCGEVLQHILCKTAQRTSNCHCKLFL